MGKDRKRLRQKQREALWKWRWLGLRDSTPGFKASLVLALVVTIYVILRGTGVL